MAFVCLGKKGYPGNQCAVDFNACKEGFDVLSLQLTEKVLNLVGTGNDVCIHPPARDPSKIEEGNI